MAPSMKWKTRSTSNSLPASVQTSLTAKARGAKITKVESLKKKDKLVAYEAANPEGKQNAAKSRSAPTAKSCRTKSSCELCPPQKERPVPTGPEFHEHVISTEAAHSFIVRCTVERHLDSPFPYPGRPGLICEVLNRVSSVQSGVKRCFNSPPLHHFRCSPSLPAYTGAD